MSTSSGAKQIEPQHPYRVGSTLQIHFKPEIPSSISQAPFLKRATEIKTELSQDWTDGFTPLNVSILRSFTPFTCAVVLVAKVLDPPSGLAIPNEFVLKLNDRRFGYRDSHRPKLYWQPEKEGLLRREIVNIMGPTRSHPIPAKYYSHPDEDDLEGGWDGWELELYIWTLKHRSYLQEALAYRYLEGIQGSYIPRLYGTVRHAISSGHPFVHPAVDFVPGLAIEHIPGPNVGELKVGVDLTKDTAHLVSRRIIDTVAKIQSLRCLHGDIRLPNFVLKNWPHDPQPVVIDFGNASVLEPGMSVDEWAAHTDEVQSARIQLIVAGRDEGRAWHIPSPYQPHVYERIGRSSGYGYANSLIEAIPDEVREMQFERILEAQGVGAREEMMQWRVKPGVRMQNDSLLYRLHPELDNLEDE
ncbi:hypothetical protein DFH06DRAFT_1134120 [Mycena polygramma]|nr:hypothetical protein DFH06DRAFT_1134120 [Mycena polygramma]